MERDTVIAELQVEKEWRGIYSRTTGREGVERDIYSRTTGREGVEKDI